MASLDSSQLASLLSVISEENTSTQTFEAITNSFHQFFSKQDFFKIGCALVTLLQNKDLIVHPTQKLVCIFFLYDMYRTDPMASNPFAGVFIYLVNPPTLTANQNGSMKEYHWSMPRLTPQEKFFVSQLISSPSKDLFKKTATQILQTESTTLHSVDVSALQVSIVEKLSELPHLSKVGIPVILSDVEVSRYGFVLFDLRFSIKVFDDINPKNETEQQKLVIESLLVGKDAPYKKFMRPEPIRLMPPLHVASDELIWLDPVDTQPEFVFDTTLLSAPNSSSSSTNEMRKLIAKAYKSQLHITQQQQLDTALSKDPSLILHAGLTPSKFAELVELNPLIAVKMIIADQELDSSDLSPYLEELLKMKMSVHSMEVVNKLANLVLLPDEFIHLYISTCISKCESMTDDKSLQNRLVRLLCVFIQSLIRNRIIDVKESYIELQPFCIEFSTIKEANSLYRLLKSMNNENNTVASNGGGSTPTKSASKGEQQGNSLSPSSAIASK